MSKFSTCRQAVRSRTSLCRSLSRYLKGQVHPEKSKVWNYVPIEYLLSLFFELNLPRLQESHRSLTFFFSRIERSDWRQTLPSLPPSQTRIYLLDPRSFSLILRNMRQNLFVLFWTVNSKHCFSRHELFPYDLRPRCAYSCDLAVTARAAHRRKLRELTMDDERLGDERRSDGDGDNVEE